MSKHIILSIFFIFSFILTGCQQEQILDQDDTEKIAPEHPIVDEPQDGVHLAEKEKNRCLDAGADWEEMPNSCGNRCDYVRTPERVSCLMALTDACICGEGMCWNGEICEAVNHAVPVKMQHTASPQDTSLPDITPPTISQPTSPPPTETPEQQSPEALSCAEAGGTWSHMSNGCGDSCIAARTPDMMCTMAFAWACDCGPDACWNGEICEAN